MSKVSGGQAIGWWFNPRTGQATAAGTFPTSDMRKLTPPAEGDWDLMLDAAAKELDPGADAHHSQSLTRGDRVLGSGKDWVSRCKVELYR